ncbi:hypothetical protein ES703_28835 [subsurface metagenome]
MLLWDVEDGLDWRTISNYNKNANGGIGWVVCANRAVLSELIQAMQWFVYGYSSSHNYSYWLGVHQGLFDRELVVTWQSIVEAWVKNDFEGRAWTIGVIDRMRQILWNEPFDLTWAARPEEKAL